MNGSSLSIIRELPLPEMAMDKLVLDLPDEVFQQLNQAASRTGTTPEDMAAQWLFAMGSLGAADPLDKFIGAFPPESSNGNSPAPVRYGVRNGLPIVLVPEGTPAIDPDAVRRFLEETTF